MIVETLERSSRTIPRECEDCKKGQNSREANTLFKQQVSLAKDRGRARAGALKDLLEANARWTAKCRDAAAYDIKQLVEEISTIIPELRKELLNSWEEELIEEKLDSMLIDQSLRILRKDKGQ